MKKIILIITAVSLTLNCLCQAPDWHWAKSAGGSANDLGKRVVLNRSGNIYVTGEFAGDSITFGSTILSNTGVSDLFLVKYDITGNVIWAKRAGGDWYTYSNGMDVDGNGNIYITGYFSSDSITFGTFTLIPAGVGDMYIVKYDASGNVVWAKSAGGNDDDAGISIAVDSIGNSYVTGSFKSDSILFGTTTLINTNLNYRDVFIVKYDTNGNVVWAKSAGGGSHDNGRSITIDNNGNSYVTGYFTSSSITFGSTILNNNGTADMFLVKYDSNGSVLWAKSAGGNNWDESNEIDADSSGNVYVMGYFSGTSIIFGTTVLTNSASTYTDMFLVKYDTAGNVLWAKSAGEYSAGKDITVDENGNCYIAGNFFGASITFGATTLTNTSVGNLTDLFVVKYDSNGNVLWAKSAGSNDNDEGYGIALDVYGNSYITGYYKSPTITFGNTTFTNTNYTGNLGDMFLAKIDGNFISTTMLNQTSCNSYTLNNQTYTTSGVFTQNLNNYLWNDSILVLQLTIDTVNTMVTQSWNNFIASAVGATYQWIDCNNGNTPITGVTNQMYTATTNGSYAVIVTQNGCTGTSLCYSLTNIGIEERVLDNAILISPNPFTSSTTITFNEPQKNTAIIIRDVLGKEIKTIHFTGTQCAVEKGEIKSGVYFLEVKTEGKIINKKIIVQ